MKTLAKFQLEFPTIRKDQLSWIRGGDGAQAGNSGESSDGPQTGSSGPSPGE